MMTDAELESERRALLAEEQELLEAHGRLHLRADDRSGQNAHRERLRAHVDRIGAFHDALFPAQPGQPRPPADRRQHRLVLLPCTACGQDDLRVLLRTPYVLYVRCEHCAAVWTVAKPGQEGFGP